MTTAVCTSCGYSRDFDDKNIGRRFKCPKCATSVLIGSAEGPLPEQSDSSSASRTSEVQSPVFSTQQASGSGKWGLWIMAAIIGAGVGTWIYFGNQVADPEYLTAVEDSLRILRFQDSILAAGSAMESDENTGSATEAEEAENMVSELALTYETEQAIAARIMDYFECYNHSVDCFRSFYADRLVRVYAKYDISADQTMQEHINYYKIYPYQEATVDVNSISIMVNEEGNFESSFTLETSLRKQPEDEPKRYTSTVYLTFNQELSIIGMYNKNSRRLQ